MPFEYNNVKTPFYSEAARTFDTPQNWTANGADTLSLYFRGRAAGFADNGNGTFTMSASGTDIWNNADQFRFAYKSLTGNGSIVARVDSIANTNVWAKGGVMIRESLDAGSTHAFMPITPGGSGAGNGASFQRRLTATGASTNDDNAGAGRGGSVLGQGRAHGQQLHRLDLPGRQDLDAAGHGPDDHDDQSGPDRPGRDQP